jgi:hypothetical protein
MEEASYIFFNLIPVLILSILSVLFRVQLVGYWFLRHFVALRRWEYCFTGTGA